MSLADKIILLTQVFMLIDSVGVICNAELGNVGVKVW